MIQEEKQLLLKNICSRFPYGVICTDLRHGDSKITEVNTEDGLVYCPDFDEYVKIENCRLYLRPMSSMTEKERRYLLEELGFDEDLENGELNDFGSYVYRSVNVLPLFDWLNEHHFDYRGLIPMGLALESPEGMYKTE